MKKGKAFTLIELLAVIVVLSIIALIAMPIIFNVIENAKVKSLENSAYGVVDAVMLQYMKNLKEGNASLTGSVTTLSLSGEHPTGGTWEIVNNADVAGGKGIKISGVTFASMEGYVCNSEEDAQGKLTGKVKCTKQESESQVGEIVFETADGIFNENGWATQQFGVKVTANDASSMKVCWGYGKECTMTIPDDNPSCLKRNLYDYVINPEGCAAFGSSMGGSQSEIEYLCADADKTLVDIAVANGISAQDLVNAGVISNYKIMEYTVCVYATADDKLAQFAFDMPVNTYTFNVLNIEDASIPFVQGGNNYVCAEAEGLQPKCEVYKFDDTTPELTVKEAEPIVGFGFNNETRKFFEEPIFGVSGGNVICKDSNNNEFTNTEDLAIGTHAVTCSAVGNNGLISNDVALTITVEEKERIRLETDTNSNGVAELGDEVCIEDECFYVLTNDGTNIRMLSKYRIDASDNTTRKNRLQNTGTLNTVFSSETIHGTNYNSYEGSIVEDLVGDYKTTLEGMGATISDATLLTESEVKGAPFNCTSLTTDSCDANYSWLYGAHHWTRSAYSGNTNYVWIVNSSGFVHNYGYDSSNGVRPVVTISTSSI